MFSPGPPMTALLVVAKAPVPGLAKTRLCPPATPVQAARVAAGALLDTLAAVRATRHVAPVLAYAGDLDAAERAEEIRLALAGWTVLRQRGDGFGERLAHAHHDAGARWPGRPVLQIGMDTPQVTPELLAASARRLSTADAVLGPARDGGWWALGLRDPRHAAVLRHVPMSTADTGRLTRLALTTAGLRVEELPTLSDVDTWTDALAVAATVPDGYFAAGVWEGAHDRPGAEPIWLVAADGWRSRLPVSRWRGGPEPAVRDLLDRCTGPTLDVGCGPGRLTAALAARGVTTLGIDTSAGAVAQACRRGGSALCRDVFAAVPGEGRWAHVLLVDGNIGIGGDPARLLRRCAALLRPGGSVLAELEAGDTGLWQGYAHLAYGHPARRTPPFRWARLGVGAVHRLSDTAGLTVRALLHRDRRWFAELVRP
jgi:rSAM/selenodomain-associated transferase 1